MSKKANMRVMRVEFEVLTVLKDECFTKTGQLRRNPTLRKGIADSLRFEAHKFIDSRSPEEIIKQSTIEIEEVEVLDDSKGEL